RPTIYIEPRKLAGAARERLESVATVRSPGDFEKDLAALGKAGRAVMLDPTVCPDALARALTENGGKIIRAADPIVPLKAVKNAAEIAGARAAQLRDGAAVARFLAWFDREAPRGALTEIDAVEALESFRRDTGRLKDISFPTIARAVFPDGTNGAQLDPLARQFLWRDGLDFDHGTGHGVGSYLSVHEGPARISKLGTAPLKRGIILSNEPGYYRAGAYGIRIE